MNMFQVLDQDQTAFKKKPHEDHRCLSPLGCPSDGHGYRHAGEPSAATRESLSCLHPLMRASLAACELHGTRYYFLHWFLDWLFLACVLHCRFPDTRSY